MNCVTHKETPAAAYCRTCGSALCNECTREVKGVVYCENCIAARLHDTLPPAGSATTVGFVAGVAGDRVVVPLNQGPSPGLAGVIAGFFPFGLGAIYNGQYGKGLVHMGVFAVLVFILSHGRAGAAEPIFGLAMAFFYIYQIFDAVRSARAKQLGQPTPDPLGIYRALGVQNGGFGGGAGTGAPAAGFVPAAGQPAAAVPEPAQQRAPVGALVLIGLGVLFLLDTMGFWHWGWTGRLWPVILIVVGVWMLMRRAPGRQR